jgi:hypothetical protein
MKKFVIFWSDWIVCVYVSESHLLVSFSTKFTLLAELIEAGPMRAQICSTGWFDQDKIKITMKMSSLMKFQIIDHELGVCEYSFWALIISRESMLEGGGEGRLELQLPATRFLYELLFYVINKCRLFNYCKGIVRIPYI